MKDVISQIWSGLKSPQLSRCVLPVLYNRPHKKGPYPQDTGLSKFSTKSLLKRVCQLWYRVEQIRDQAIIGDLEDRCFVIFVDGDDDL